MRILLVSLNRETEPFTAAPLGMALVCGSLASDGHELRSLDLLSEPEPEKAVSAAVSEFRPGLIGLSLRNIESSTEFLMPSYQRIVAAVRGATAAPILLGGPGFSVMPEQALRYLGADYGIKGEGEVAARGLARAVEKGQDAADIPGVCTYRSGRFSLSAPTAVDDLDGLAACSWEGLKPGAYDMVGVQSKRGCSFGCTYCTYPALEGRRMRLRSPESVALEIDGLARRHNVSTFYFVDNVFNNPRSHALDICSALSAMNPGAHWGCLASPLGLDGELAGAMKEAGCESVEIGADSLSDKALKGLGKPFRAGVVANAVTACKSAGMAHMVFMILGGPGEDEDTIRESFDALDRLAPDKVFAVSGIRVYPDTPIHRLAVEAGLVAPDDDLLEPRFYVSEDLGERLYEMADEYFKARPGWIYYRANAILDRKPDAPALVTAWEDAAQGCLSAVMEEVPKLLRPIAKKAVIRKAGRLASSRGLPAVSSAEVVDAFMDETPVPFRGALEKSLRRLGFIA